MRDRMMRDDFAASSQPQFKVPFKLSAGSFDWLSEGIDQVLFWDTVHVSGSEFAQKIKRIKGVQHYSQLLNVGYLNLHAFLWRDISDVYLHNVLAFLTHLSVGSLFSFLNCCLILLLCLIFFLYFTFHPCVCKCGYKFMEAGIGIDWEPIRQLKVFISIVDIYLSHGNFSKSTADIDIVIDLLERNLNDPFRGYICLLNSKASAAKWAVGLILF